MVTVEAGGVLIINGGLNNSNNSGGIEINGELIVNGDFTGGNGSAITGTGTMNTSGTISTSGSGSVFGSTGDCTTGPCSGNNLCGLTNSITSGNVTICSGGSTTLSGSTPTGGVGPLHFYGNSVLHLPAMALVLLQELTMKRTILQELFLSLPGSEEKHLIQMVVIP